LLLVSRDLAIDAVNLRLSTLALCFFALVGLLGLFELFFKAGMLLIHMISLSTALHHLLLQQIRFTLRVAELLSELFVCSLLFLDLLVDGADFRINLGLLVALLLRRLLQLLECFVPPRHGAQS